MRDSSFWKSKIHICKTFVTTLLNFISKRCFCWEIDFWGYNFLPHKWVKPWVCKFEIEKKEKRTIKLERSSRKWLTRNDESHFSVCQSLRIKSCDLGLLLTPALVYDNKYIQGKESFSIALNGKKCCQVLDEEGFYPLSVFSKQNLYRSLWV